MKRHGMPEHNSWRAMVDRCRNPRNTSYANYGGRGITVCERWLRFDNFLADMGPRPSPSHSIDRINNDGNYEPGNVRWATRSQQILNSRQARLITAFGRTRHLSEWSAETGIKITTIVSRIDRNGYTAEEALTRGRSS